MTAGIRPLSLLFHEQPTDPWKKADFLLLEAYQILQDETCPTCGNPIWICRAEDDNIRFKMESSVCFADKTETEWRNQKDRNAKRVGKKEAWEPAPGEQWFPIPITQDGGPLPTRFAYYKGLADKMEG